MPENDISVHTHTSSSIYCIFSKNIIEKNILLTDTQRQTDRHTVHTRTHCALTERLTVLLVSLLRRSFQTAIHI